MERPLHALLPDISIIPLDIVYEVVARLLQSREQAQHELLVSGQKGRLGWWRLPPGDSWIHDPDPVDSDHLKCCKLAEIQWLDGRRFLHLVEREKNPDVGSEGYSTIEIDGQLYRVLANDSFGLSRDDLVRIYPELAPERHLAPSIHKVVTALIAVFPPDGNPGQQLSEIDICKKLEKHGLRVGPPDKPNSEKLDHVSRDTFYKALKHVRR